MKRLLICTIARDCESRLERWWNCLANLSELLLGHGYVVELSVVENDSKDGTAQWLRERRENWLGAPCPHLKAEAFHLSTETLGTQRYGSVWSVDRLRNLAAARQKCLDQVGAELYTFDKIAFVEVDVTYDPRWCAELILARHPLAAGLGEPDIYSGWSLRTEANPKESVFLYDCCATRQEECHRTWDFANEGEWRPSSVIPTDLGGHDAMCLHGVWSTFNGFCVYNARPFKEGLRWDCWNHRLDTGQVRSPDGLASLDADTSVMCESFRAHGYDKVFLNTNALIRHS